MRVLGRFRRDWGLYLFIAVSVVAYAGLVGMDWLYGTLRASRTPQTIGWYLIAFFAYLGALVWAEKRGMSKWWMWGAAICFRLLLLLTTPTLSDDVYRYLWDGYVANEGVSPYAYAINAPELDYLDIPLRALANNAWMASPYLPVAQGVFFGVTAVLPLRPLFLQIIMVFFDLAGAWLLARLLVLATLPARRLLIYLWNPLVIVEVAHGAHVDSWMLLLAVLAVYFALKESKQSSANSEQPIVNSQQITVNSQQPTVKQKIAGSGRGERIVNISNSLFRINYSQFFSPVFLALATLTKILPVLLLPVLFWFWNWWQRVLFGGLLLILLLPFGWQAGWGLTGELDGRGLFGALRIYGEQWNFNSGLFHWLEVALGNQGLADPATVSKGIVAVVFVLLVTAVWWLARTRQSNRAALRLMAIPLIGYVLLTPTLHPWYILILLAFVPFLGPSETEHSWRWLLVAPWLYLSGALIFSYLTYLDPLNFGELEWVRRLEWVPLLGLLVIAAIVGLFRFTDERESDFKAMGITRW
jgi:hypothetical protein